MRRISIVVVVACCVFGGTIGASALDRKAGLWELTTTMTWQRSPFPPGAGPAVTGNGTSRTTLVCFTEEQIQKYGAIMPPQHATCTIANVVKKPKGMTADMVCTGRMNGKASLESSWPDAEHATGKLHFVGTMQMGKTTAPVEWTVISSSVFKGAECGTVKPFPMPDK